jgi:PhnB protein
MMAIKEVFAYLSVNDAPKAIEFYQKAFGATEKYRLVEPGSGRVGHAELDFGGNVMMLADEYPELNFRGPDKLGGTSVMIHLHVDDCDQVIERAIAAGAKLDRPPKNEFYGERSGTVIDPFGHRWSIGHHLEDVPPEEMQRRYDQVMKGA